MVLEELDQNGLEEGVHLVFDHDDVVHSLQSVIIFLSLPLGRTHCQRQIEHVTNATQRNATRLNSKNYLHRSRGFHCSVQRDHRTNRIDVFRDRKFFVEPAVEALGISEMAVDPMSRGNTAVIGATTTREALSDASLREASSLS